MTNGNRSFKRIVHLVLACLLISLSACRSTASRAVLIEDVLAEVPLGTSSATATEIMTKHGYRCESVEKGEFTANFWNGESHTSSQKFADIDFIKCTKKSGNAIAMIYDNVALVIDESGNVTDLLRHRVGVGP